MLVSQRRFSVYSCIKSIFFGERNNVLYPWRNCANLATMLLSSLSSSTSTSSSLLRRWVGAETNKLFRSSSSRFLSPSLATTNTRCARMRRLLSSCRAFHVKASTGVWCDFTPKRKRGLSHSSRRRCAS